MNSSEESIQLDEQLIKIIWGNEINRSIVDRWSQSFQFSPYERTALIQFEGGPCSVLTPVQAHLIQQMIHCQRYSIDQWRQANKDEIDLHFLNALISILCLLNKSSNDFYLGKYSNEENFSSIEEFHRNVRFVHCRNKIQLKEEIYSRLNLWKRSFGVLLFLYSCLMTKTIDKLRQEIDDETSLPLIDTQFGHGSQSLTNLLITGQATQHCFDGEKDVSGLKLKGIQQQAFIGFLSSLEIYRLLEVGSFLKNPRYPIWILASETHLTVLFSNNSSLVDNDRQKPMERSLQIFQKYDTEKNGFVSVTLFDQVIQEMSQQSLIDTNLSIECLKKQLDPDQLGIITQSSFLQLFYPQKNQFEQNNENTFQIYHYNGLLRSNLNNQVRYVQGSASIYEFDYNRSTNNSNSSNTSNIAINVLLRTKWSNIEVNWDEQAKPSLN